MRFTAGSERCTNCPEITRYIRGQRRGRESFPFYIYLRARRAKRNLSFNFLLPSRPPARGSSRYRPAHEPEIAYLPAKLPLVSFLLYTLFYSPSCAARSLFSRLFRPLSSSLRGYLRLVSLYRMNFMHFALNLSLLLYKKTFELKF